MDRTVLLRKTGPGQIFFYQRFHRLNVDPLAQATDEQGIFMPGFRRDTVGKIGVDSIEARLVQIDDALLVALSQKTQAVVWKIAQVDIHKLGHAHTAI